MIGFMYRYGRGVDMDLQKAREWYQRAADQGYTNARNELADMGTDGQ